MAWQNPKTNWKGGDVPSSDDFNRIEGNIEELENTKETPAGAQEKADAAEQNAKNFATDIVAPVASTANAALPKSGGTMTGEINMADNLLTRPYLKDYAEVRVASTNVSGTKTLDVSTGNVFDLTLAGNTTLAFTNPSASGRACSITVIIRMPSTVYSVTFPSSVKWNDDIIPEFEANKTAILTFVTVDGGNRWYGMTAGTEFTT